MTRTRRAEWRDVGECTRFELGFVPIGSSGTRCWWPRLPFRAAQPLRERTPLVASPARRWKGIERRTAATPMRQNLRVSAQAGSTEASSVASFTSESVLLPSRSTRNRLKEVEGDDFVAFLQRAVEECRQDKQRGRRGGRDLVWERVRQEAQMAAAEEQLLASFLYSTVVNHATLESALAFHLANKLASPTLPSTILNEIFRKAMRETPDYGHIMRFDLLAVADRDPACTRIIDALLFFKGFHALQAHRVAHWLWQQRRYPLALALQSQVSKELQIDIHPAAWIGFGLFVDHGTGVVIGETARIGNNVSMLHHVTLGGTGTKLGDRHPKVEDGVLIGAGATILGNVTIGRGAMVGACTLLTTDLPPHSSAVGVPGRVIGVPRVATPATEMDQNPTHCMQRRSVEQNREQEVAGGRNGSAPSSSAS